MSTFITQKFFLSGNRTHDLKVKRQRQLSWEGSHDNATKDFSFILQMFIVTIQTTNINQEFIYKICPHRKICIN